MLIEHRYAELHAEYRAPMAANPGANATPPGPASDLGNS